MPTYEPTQYREAASQHSTGAVLSWRQWVAFGLVYGVRVRVLVRVRVETRFRGRVRVIDGVVVWLGLEYLMDIMRSARPT